MSSSRDERLDGLGMGIVKRPSGGRYPHRDLFRRLIDQRVLLPQFFIPQVQPSAFHTQYNLINCVVVLSPRAPSSGSVRWDPAGTTAKMVRRKKPDPLTHLPLGSRLWQRPTLWEGLARRPASSRNVKRPVTTDDWSRGKHHGDTTTVCEIPCGAGVLCTVGKRGDGERKPDHRSPCQRRAALQGRWGKLALVEQLLEE